MASSSSWVPPQGRTTVRIGPSLVKAIKNRKLKDSPAPPVKRTNLPERDFYSFKFNFKASSADGTKAASIETSKGPDSVTQVRAEFPSTQPGEIHKFNGVENVAKDVDCILIYDENTGEYSLEKLDSYVQLKFDRKVMVSPPPASPAPATMNKGKGKQEDVEINDVPQETSIDARQLEEIMQQAVALRQEEEEEEEGEEVEPPRPPVKIPTPPPAKPVRPIKSMPKLRTELPPKPIPAQPVAALPPPQPKAKAMPSKAKKVKQAPPLPPPTVYPDEEVIEFGKPPAKRARVSPPPRQPVAPTPPPPRAVSPLSFPGGSTPAFAPPPAPVVPKPKPIRSIAATMPAPPPEMPPSPQPILSDSDDDEEDWEQVPTVTPVISQSQPDYEAELEEDIFGDGFADEGDIGDDGDGGDGGEDIDENDFEQMMNEQMEGGDSEDDFLASAVSPEPPDRQPISLNRLASGGAAAAESDDDDFSSSEESDD